MADIAVKKIKGLKGAIQLPGDKSISHRSVMIGSIANKETVVENLLKCEDVLCTMEAFRAMGVKIDENKDNVIVRGNGLMGLKKPKDPIYLGNSGTSMRLLLGILAGQDFEATLTGDPSLSKRPMKRVTVPLRQMGAAIEGAEDANFAPLKIIGSKKLSGITYKMPESSAQVKSSILLAGLYAQGQTTVIEPSKSRDHTERMLRLFGSDIKEEGLKVSIKGGKELSTTNIKIPGDISAAAFFIVASSIIKNSCITIKDIGLNPTRTGIIDILESMGAKIDILIHSTQSFEPRGDLTVSASKLKGTVIKGDMIPRAIDELPICMVAACFANGITKIIGAKELRVKETDRINSMVTNLKKMGAEIEVENDDIIIEGTGKLKGARVDSFKDHRTAMSMVVAGMASEGETTVQDTDCVKTSFPGFMDTFSKVASSA